MAGGICGTLGAIQNQATSLIGLVLRKAIQLERLAQLLTTSAVGIPLPNIDGLLALSQIGPNTYNQLRAACPLLGLPPMNTQSLNELVAAVRAAYQQLQNDLIAHPFASLAGLDDQLNQFISQAENALFSAIGPGMSMLQCLNTLCAAGAAVGATASQTASLFQAQASTAVSSATPGGYGTVLDPSMRAQVQQYQITSAGLASLMDVPTSTVPAPTPLSSITQPFSQDPAAQPVQAANVGNSNEGMGFNGIPPTSTNTTGNQAIQNTYDDQYSYLVRQGLCGQAVRETLQSQGAMSSNDSFGSAYQYYDYLNGLSSDPNSGWSAVHADNLNDVPPGGVTVFDAVERGQPDPSTGSTATGYANGHVMIGSNYNGSAAVSGNWMGGGTSGGTYFIYKPSGG